MFIIMHLDFSNLWLSVPGRLLIGFGSGMVGAPARVYTCEVSQPHLRGMLGALASVGVSTGVLIVVSAQNKYFEPIKL